MATDRPPASNWVPLITGCGLAVVGTLLQVAYLMWGLPVAVSVAATLLLVASIVATLTQLVRLMRHRRARRQSDESIHRQLDDEFGPN